MRGEREEVERGRGGEEEDDDDEERTGADG